MILVIFTKRYLVLSTIIFEKSVNFAGFVRPRPYRRAVQQCPSGFLTALVSVQVTQKWLKELKILKMTSTTDQTLSNQISRPGSGCHGNQNSQFPAFQAYETPQSPTGRSTLVRRRIGARQPHWYGDHSFHWSRSSRVEQESHYKILVMGYLGISLCGISRCYSV